MISKNIIYENGKVFFVCKLNNTYLVDIAKIPKEEFDLDIEETATLEYGNWLIEKNHAEQWSYISEQLKMADPVPHLEDFGFIKEKDLDKYQKICSKLNYKYHKYCDDISKLKEKLKYTN